MKLTISWLKKFLNTQATDQQIITALTNIGLEVEEVVNQADIYKNFLVAEIISTIPHPEADKLRVCQVNNGKEFLQIVCGAPNARAGIKVVLAPIGTEIPANGLKIKESKIRNVASFGMMCSGAELNLTSDSDGIIELPAEYLVGSSFAENYGLNEVMIEISVTPNRGDCLGIYGIARDLAAAGLGTLNALNIIHHKEECSSPIKVTIANPELAPRYVGRYFQGVKNQESPAWLKQNLESIGLKPISALVDITNYFTYAFNRPLHVFDADLISDIIVRQATKDEEFTALNDKSYILKGGELVISDSNKILGLAGIIGEKDSGVSLTSKNIFLEIGLFDADEVAKASRLHQIDTDAKFRFERHVDPEFLATALELATAMILEICGGKPSVAIIVDNYKKPATEINFSLSELKKRIGIAYEKDHVQTILLSLGFLIKDLGESLHLTVPSWRLDIKAKEDIVEEIARIDGYDKITALPLDIPNSSNILNAKQRMLYRVRRFPASLGLNETVSWSFMNSSKAAYFSELQTELYLKNPISSELDYMRPSILPNLLEAIVKNQNRGSNNLALFEFGSIFQGIKPEQQLLTITGLRSGLNNDRNLYNDSRNIDVFDSKEDCFKIIAEMGLDPSKLQYAKAPSYYHPGRSSALTLGNKIIAFFGEIHPKIAQYYDLKTSLVGFEIFLDNIPVSKPKLGRKGALQASDYQAIERDFAFLMDKNIETDKIIRSVMQCDKKLIKDVNIFDIYQGKGMGESEKSVAFSVTIQATDHTLLEQEIEQLCQKIIEAVTIATNGTLRKA